MSVQSQTPKRHRQSAPPPQWQGEHPLAMVMYLAPVPLPPSAGYRIGSQPVCPGHPCWHYAYHRYRPCRHSVAAAVPSLIADSFPGRVLESVEYRWREHWCSTALVL